MTVILGAVLVVIGAGLGVAALFWGAGRVLDKLMDRRS